MNTAGELQILYIIILQHYQAESICSEIQILSQFVIRFKTVMMTLIQLTAFLSISVMVRWRGRTQGVWPASWSRGTVTYSGVASNHNSHHNGNYNHLNNHNYLLNCLLFGRKIYRFWAQEIRFFSIFISPPLHSAAWSIRITAPHTLRLCSVSKHISTADPLHTVIN